MSDGRCSLKPFLLAAVVLIAAAVQAHASERASATSSKVFDGLLAYVHSGDIYAIRPDGGSRQRLTRVGTAADPAWSPDGTQIAYAVGHDWEGGDGDLWSIRADGTDRAQLTSGPADDVQPTWSPDGTRIAFVRAEVGVVVLTLATGAVQTLVPATDEVSLSSPAWSPDGTQVAVVRKMCGDFDCGSVVVAATVGDPAAPAQVLPGWNAVQPDWSPDGTNFAYQEEDDDDPCGGSLVVARVDGTERHYLPMGECAGGGSPSWSPRGGWIAFVSSGPALTGDIGDMEAFDHGGIWTTRPDGTGRRLVTREGGSPDWQPVSAPLPRRGDPAERSRGTGRIVYSSASWAWGPSIGVTGVDIFSVAADGSQRRRLTWNGVSADPVWSPNGRRILYRSHAWAPGDWVGGIWVMRRDGMWKRPVVIGHGSHPSWAPDGQRFVYETGLGLRVYRFRSVRPRWIFRSTSSSRCAASPDWSPEGGWIVFARSVNIHQCELFKVRPDGSDLTRITTSAGSETEPAWSPDGTRIAFTYRTFDRQRHTGREAIHVVDAGGGQRRRVLTLPGLNAGPTWAPNGRRLAAYSEGPDRYGPSPWPGLWTVALDGSRLRLVERDRAAGQLDWWGKR